MPSRKKDEPELREPTVVRVRVEPYFAVSVVDDSSGARHAELFLGRTAREALNRAKSKLLRKGTDDRLLVVNGKVIHAISWANPIYPDDDTIIDEVMRITGGTLLE